jgi:hypothetical protein
VWQLPQPLARKTAFPFAALPAAGAVAGAVVAPEAVCVTLGVAAVVVAALVPADAETVTVRVTLWLPEVEWPIAQPTTPAGTSNAKNRSQIKTSPTVTARFRSLFGATAEPYRGATSTCRRRCAASDGRIVQRASEPKRSFRRILRVIGVAGRKVREMQKLSRGRFLKKAGAAAGVAAVAGAPGLAKAATERDAEVVDAPGAIGKQPVVAFIRDADRAEVTVLHGTRETTYRDRGLVKRLLKAARANGLGGAA